MKPDISEMPLDHKVMRSLDGAMKEGLSFVNITPPAKPEVIVNAIDEFIFNWQSGKRDTQLLGDEGGLPYALGSLWGQQLIEQFGWEWVCVQFHKHNDSIAYGVASPDRSLIIYPFHFLMGALKNKGVDVTIMLAFNMLVAGKLPLQPPKSFRNVMDGVRRIVPRS